MKRFSRIALIVLDSVGIGELPDAALYGDVGTHTLGNTARHRGGLKLPHLQRLGLGNIVPVEGVHPVDGPEAHYGKMAEISKGKDTTTGHWELMGIETDKPFKTWPEGFPAELIEVFERRTGRKVIGNKPASGTEIIKELGEEHMKTGALIVYTSADSVFQIAAHEEVVPLDELYRICEIARELTLDERYSVVRVIARPFVGEPGHFVRTANRRDYSVKPPAKTVLNALAEIGKDVIGIGKISDIYAGEGITRSISSKSNMDGVDKLLDVLNTDFDGLAFLNLVDFDAKYGHRRDPDGYARALEEFDARVPEILDALGDDDLLIITADHGNDPTHHGTDHTREYVPLLVWSHALSRPGNFLGVRGTFADVGATVAENFGAAMPVIGRSFLGELR
ncbi:phosphopentomutase [Staphylospora marina]|uniref:phosphopentomutase n=1 Tax=Staphylospora marina TaxID=2490858 RepID=UPI000F5BF52F|nr:phosphopentomutase [Staphylospora marina]